MKRKTIYIIVVLLLVCATVFGGIYLNKKSIDNAYNYAITLIQNGSYEQALAELEKVNPKLLNRKEFKDDIKYQKLDDAYKNTVPLYAYTLAQLEYNSENRYMRTVNEYLELIPADYSGELCEEIKTFKGNFKPQYENFLAEEKRKAEEAIIEQQKREQEYIASLKNKIPFEGMQEKYINSTAAGNADKHESEYVKGRGSKPGYDLDKYYWYSDNNNDMVLFVECKDGKVTDVIKYYESTYWTSNGMPKFWATRPARTTKKNKSIKKDDPYNVNDYYDPEDFYDDNYDDFWDYEDAEDYFNEHHD